MWGQRLTPAASPVPRPCPRAAAPLCTLKAGAGQVSLTLGTARGATAVNGQHRFPVQSAKLARETTDL